MKTIKIQKKVIVSEKWVIICSVCGAKSNYAFNDFGSIVAKKWEGRDWFCKEHRPDGWGHSEWKPLCTCGHRKFQHNYPNGKCNKCLNWKGDIYCDCKKYDPVTK